MVPPSWSAETLNTQLQLANTLYAAGKLVKAAEIYRHLLKQFPRKLFLLNRLGEIALRGSNFVTSIAYLRKSLEISPHQPLAYVALGMALSMNKEVDAALEAYERAAALKPDLALAHNNKGILLAEQGRSEDALVSFDRAVTAQPEFAEAICNRGAVLKMMDRYDEAMAAFRRALEVDPAMARAHFAIGQMQGDQRQFGQSIASFDAALAIEPGNAQAASAKAEALLLLGEYAQGWQLYVRRLQSKFRKNFFRHPPFAGIPNWPGDGPVAGKTVVVRPEVGLGDFIMFVRYANLFLQHGAKPVLYTPEPLVTLFGSLGPGVTVVSEGEPLPPVDFQCAIMELPRVFGTTLATVPAEFPYLWANEEKRTAWRAKLGPKIRPRIGLMWSGKGDRKIDSNALRRRTMPLDALGSMLDLPLEFHALQKELLAVEQAAVESSPNLVAHHHELHDMSDTAALVAEMDLVISIDTSVAHLAGALGKPLWVMLPYASDYRWALGAQTPWYPHARLFRQSAPADWPGVIREVTTRLQAEFERAPRRKP